MNCWFQGHVIVADPYLGGLFHSRPFHVRLVVVKSGTGKGFTPRTSVFAFQYHSTNTPYSFASEYYYCNTRRTRGRTLGTFRQSNAVSDIRDHYTQKYFHIFLRASSIKTSLIMTPEKKSGYNEYKIRTFMKVY